MGSFKKFLMENDDVLHQIYDLLTNMSDEEIDEFGFYLYDEFFDGDEADDDIDTDTFTEDDVKQMIMGLGPDMYDDILDMLLPDPLDDDDDDLDNDAHNTADYEDDIHSNSPVSEAYKYTDNDWVVLEGRKSVRLVKNTKRNVHPANWQKDSKENAIYRISHAKKIGIDLSGLMGNDLPTINEGVGKKMKVKNFNRKKRKFMTNTKADMRRTAAQRRISNLENRAARKRYYRANKVKIAAYQKSRVKAIDSGKHNVKLRRGA